jgi:F-type H+-transporting ATPase subunit epsilon
MADKADKIKVKIITHQKIVLECDADAVYTQGPQGRFGILPHHIPITSALDIGVTKIVQGKKNTYLTTMGGVLQFVNNELTILTDTAEFGTDIDIVRAKEAKERAEARIDAHGKNTDIIRAQIALAKAIARIRAHEREAHI